MFHGIFGAVEAHQRRRALVLQIWALTSKATAYTALVFAYLARARHGGSVEGYLLTFKELAMAGALR
jgi:hypothetical protein